MNEYTVLLDSATSLPELVKDREHATCVSRIQNDHDLVALVNNAFRLNQAAEEFCYMIACNNAQDIIGLFQISHGVVNSTILSPREILMRALLSGASLIFLVHNHPSGSLNPSQEDLDATKKILQAGELMGIRLVDHIVVARDGYCSLRKYWPEMFVAK